MTELGNIARPYARALFDLAQERDDLADWSEWLDVLATVAVDANMVDLTKNPRISPERLQSLILAMAMEIILRNSGWPVATDSDFPNDLQGLYRNQSFRLLLHGENLRVAGQVINLVKLLVRNGRILILPEIASTYAALRVDAERTIAATMTTAVDIDARQRARFIEAMQLKFKRKVALEFLVDEGIIGGAIVRAGDLVIDASVRGQLQQLAGALDA